MKRRAFLGLAALGGVAAVAPFVILRRRRAPAPVVAQPLALFTPRLSETPRVVVDDDGNHYRLHLFSGRVEFVGRRAQASLPSPVSLVVDGKKRVLVLSKSGALAILDGNARAQGVFGPGGLSSPSDLATWGERLIVADTLHHQIQFLDGDGREAGRFGQLGLGRKSGELNGPSSVAVVGERLYIADAGNARVVLFERGKFSDAFGGYGRDDGRLLSARCVRVDGSNNIHVADPVSGCVHVFDSSHRFVRRDRPATIPLWLSRLPDGGILPTLG